MLKKNFHPILSSLFTQKKEHDEEIKNFKNLAKNQLWSHRYENEFLYTYIYLYCKFSYCQAFLGLILFNVKQEEKKELIFSKNLKGGQSKKHTFIHCKIPLLVKHKSHNF